MWCEQIIAIIFIINYTTNVQRVSRAGMDGRMWLEWKNHRKIKSTKCKKWGSKTKWIIGKWLLYKNIIDTSIFFLHLKTNLEVVLFCSDIKGNCVLNVIYCDVWFWFWFCDKILLICHGAAHPLECTSYQWVGRDHLLYQLFSP